MPEKYRKFTDLNELIAEIKRVDSLWYQAPMDPEPVAVHVKQYTISNAKPERSRVTLAPSTRMADVFVAGLAEHFDRFRIAARYQGNTNPEDVARERARQEWANDECEIDANAVVSMGDDPGAFVAAWVWVDLSDLFNCECGRKLDQCATFEGEKEHGDR